VVTSSTPTLAYIKRTASALLAGKCTDGEYGETVLSAISSAGPAIRKCVFARAPSGLGAALSTSTTIRFGTPLGEFDVIF
jgi:hypothetical protein